MNLRLITIHDLRSKVHAVWLVIIGRAVGVAEIIPDNEFYKTDTPTPSPEGGENGKG